MTPEQETQLLADVAALKKDVADLRVINEKLRVYIDGLHGNLFWDPERLGGKAPPEKPDFTPTVKP